MKAAPRVEPPSIEHAAFVERIDATCANKRLLAAGRLLVEKGMYSFSGFKAVKVDLLADWTINPYQQRSWQMSTAALNFLPWLIAYHATTCSRLATDFAMEAIRSWRKASASMANYEFARHDHATALRAENAMLLLAYMHRVHIHEECWPEIAEFVDELALRLEDEACYSRHTNHGLSQARILALSAALLPGQAASKRRWELAKDRMLDELRFAFTADGVHVENSPAYHQYVCEAFLKIARAFPRELLASLNNEIDAVMPKAMRFLVHVIRPDGKFPIIGDTGSVAAANPFNGYADHPEHRWLDYVSSGRTQGEAPANCVESFPQAGYLVVRDRWHAAGEQGQEFHLVMKCGFNSRYHRHDDDFNIVLVRGEDWLIDGGGYSYAEYSPVRRYLRSKWAHNVPVIDGIGERWPRLPDVMHRARLLDVEIEDGGVQATAESEAYPGYAASRRLHVVAGEQRFSVVDVLDPLEASEEVLFRSLWHVPAKRDIFRRGQDILVRSRTSDEALRIRNVGPSCDSVGVLRPKLEHYANAVVSWRANHLQPAKIIAFSKRARAFHCRLEFDLTLVPSADLEGWERL